MAIKGYFFNAVESGGTYDRVYNAEDVTSYLDLIVGSGVFPNPSTNLQVRASTGMNVPPELLHIEVTESLFSDQIDELVEILTKCQKNGYKIELDDFGSGINDLETVELMEPDIVKLDRGLISGIDHDSEKQDNVENLVSHFHSKGMLVVAEGVEEKAEFDYLVGLGVDLYQGFYLARPA